MERVFILTSVFEKSWANMGLGDKELRELQPTLLKNPDAGDVIPDLAGARKIRIPLAGRGKSGGGRVIYVDVVIREQIYLLLAYPKNVQTDLNPAQKKVIRNLIEMLKEEP